MDVSKVLVEENVRNTKQAMRGLMLTNAQPITSKTSMTNVLRRNKTEDPVPAAIRALEQQHARVASVVATQPVVKMTATNVDPTVNVPTAYNQGVIRLVRLERIHHN